MNNKKILRCLAFSYFFVRVEGQSEAEIVLVGTMGFLDEMRSSAVRQLGQHASLVVLVTVQK